MKQIHIFKKKTRLRDFLKGATLSDFIETRLSNYKPLAIRIRNAENLQQSCIISAKLNIREKSLCKK